MISRNSFGHSAGVEVHRKNFLVSLGEAGAKLATSVVLVLVAIGVYTAFPVFQDRPYAYVTVVLLLFAASLGPLRTLFMTPFEMPDKKAHPR
jgi:hypothetical protein